ncbi:MAG: chemotaxis protein CheX [Treponema sp.]|nr:chemotaxis protein CheX [Treponema sp.]
MNIDEELGQIFSSVLMEIVSTISGFSLDIIPDSDESFDEMTGIMSLCDNNSRILFISAKEKDMRQLCSYMIGVPQEEISSDDVDDSLCELVNMAAGSAKLRLSGSDCKFNLSSPFLLKGDNMRISGKKKTRIISKTLGNGDITIKIKIVY